MVDMQIDRFLDAKMLAREGGMCSEKLDFSYLGIYNLWNEELGRHSLLIYFYFPPDLI